MMTGVEALAEAQRRYGVGAHVELQVDFDQTHGTYLVLVDERVVGRSGGTGGSWEAALADADRPDKFGLFFAALTRECLAAMGGSPSANSSASPYYGADEIADPAPVSDELTRG